MKNLIFNWQVYEQSCKHILATKIKFNNAERLVVDRKCHGEKQFLCAGFLVIALSNNYGFEVAIL